MKLDISRNTLALMGYVKSLKAHYGLVKYVECRVHVPVEHKPAIRAVVRPVPQFLRDNDPTATTRLTGIVRGDPYEVLTSLFSFVGNLLNQVRPGGIRDTARQMPVLQHVLYCQFFNRNQVEAFYHCCADLMQVRLPGVLNLPVNTGDGAPRLDASLAAALGAGQFPVGKAQVPLMLPGGTKGRDSVAVTERGQCLQAHVDAHRAGNVHLVGGRNRDREAHIPSLSGRGQSSRT